MPAWRIRRPRPRTDKGLRACPDCGRLNGWLQRGAGNVCAIGVGCRKTARSVLRGSR